MASHVAAREATDADHVCVMNYDLLRRWSVCPDCGHITTDEQVYRAARASEQRELTR